MTAALPTILTSLLLAAGCEGGAPMEKGLRHFNQPLMALISSDLDRREIPHRISEDGFLRFCDEDATRVSDIFWGLEKAWYSGAESHFVSPENTALLKQILDRASVPYIVEPRKDGEWIRWYPRSEEEEASILREFQRKWFGEAHSRDADA